MWSHRSSQAERASLSSAKRSSSNLKRSSSSASSARLYVPRRTRLPPPRLIEQGVDMTPSELRDHSFPTAPDAELTLFSSSVTLVPGSPDRLQQNSSFTSKTGQLGTHSVEESIFDNSDLSGVISVDSADVPPPFSVPKEPQVIDMPAVSGPAKAIRLSETDTFYLLIRPSQRCPEDSPLGEFVKTDNEYYEYITVGKGRNRKTNSSETQTESLMRKFNMTATPRLPRSNSCDFASVWDIYDTYCLIEGRTPILLHGKTPFVHEKVEDLTLPQSRQMLRPPADNEAHLPERQIAELVTKDSFKRACAQAERILDSNFFDTEQKVFKDLLEPDPLRMNVEYNYRLDLLWTFSCEEAKGKVVTAMCWNETNKNLLAVGYGKFGDQDSGLVCVWCVKNPSQPERTFVMPSPVTALAFSVDHPNQLAVGRFDGGVLLLDVSSNAERVMARNDRLASESLSPVWQVAWFPGEDYQHFEEQLMAASQDGRINNYLRTKGFAALRMMRLSRKQGELKGLSMSRECFADVVPVSCHPAALVLRRHPTDATTYLVATDEGCVHRCSTNYLHNHLDLFQAHRGPIYSLQYSPFCKKVFLTAGGDWCVRVWVEGVWEPVATLSSGMDYVWDAAWSPALSLVLACTTANEIQLWDLRRSAFQPASITPLPPTDRSGQRLLFSPSGQSLLVGDDKGEVHVYALRDMPYPPFYQEGALAAAFKKLLVTKPALLRKLVKVGPPFRLLQEAAL